MVLQKSNGLQVLPPLPAHEYSIDVKDLTFSYPDLPPTLTSLSMQLKPGSRCLLMGSNGSGKSTLLRILSGRHLTHPDDAVMVLGMNSFRDTKLNFHRAYLDCDWGMRTTAFSGTGAMTADIPVSGMMAALQAEYPERRDELIEMLGIDTEWRMHQLSDGQRRRVQLLIGLIRPFKILLLDEITTSLDVCVRQDLLRWLVKESEERKATILYATHIFDGLDDWPTSLMYLTDKGECGWQGGLQDLPLYRELQASNHPAKMLAVADGWLRAELVARRLNWRKEKAAGMLMEDGGAASDPTNRQGGYASGRNIKMTPSVSGNRTGRLSDMMGNAGKSLSHR
jgi:CCR4-NOT complex subunit CAF16